MLADGSESLFDIYEATIVWDGMPRRIAVDAADTDPLLGMALLYGYELKVDDIDVGGLSPRGARTGGNTLKAGP